MGSSQTAARSCSLGSPFGFSRALLAIPTPPWMNPSLHAYSPSLESRIFIGSLPERSLAVIQEDEGFATQGWGKMPNTEGTTWTSSVRAVGGQRRLPEPTSHEMPPYWVRPPSSLTDEARIHVYREVSPDFPTVSRAAQGSPILRPGVHYLSCHEGLRSVSLPAETGTACYRGHST